MKRVVEFAEDGAHFRITDFEHAELDKASQEFAGVRLAAQPIDKVVRPLRLLAVAKMKSALIANTGPMPYESISKPKLEVFSRALEGPIRRSVADIGRLTVGIYRPEEIDLPDVEPVDLLEFTGPNYRWARHVVEFHRDSLHEYGRDTVLIPPELLADKPTEGADTALAYQGLKLASSENELIHNVEIVRLTKHEYDQLPRPIQP